MKRQRECELLGPGLRKSQLLSPCCSPLPCGPTLHESVFFFSPLPCLSRGPGRALRADLACKLILRFPVLFGAGAWGGGSREKLSFLVPKGLLPDVLTPQ